LLLLAVLLLACQRQAQPTVQGKEEGTMGLKVVSSAFQEGGMIPSDYTCDGKDISPPLAWSGAPAGTAAFALVCEDPDAPAGVWVHWVVWNLPASVSELPTGVPPAQKTLPNGGTQGTNDFRKIGYGGPCPPSGTHRYQFRLYALDKVLDLKPGATKKELLKAMGGHILAEGQLMGHYKRR
jgi:hypothetical protein